MKKYLYIYIFLIFSSCSKYQKVLKSDDFSFKFKKAVEYYQSEEFNKALPIFDELRTIMLGKEKMEEVSYYFAYSHYSTGDLISAAYLFDLFSKNYPNSKYVEECAFMSAYCYYLLAPDYSLDATNNYKGINALQNFVNYYPYSKRNDECNKYIDELRKKLALKAFSNAKQYFTTQNYKSALVAFNNVLIDFPSTNNREEIQYLIVKSSFLLAINSISKKIEERLSNTLDAYEQFKDNYSNSEYLKELNEIKEKTISKLNNIKINKNEI